jgi:quinoprotein glucose dehydrogenase
MPGVTGGASWSGGAWDPETGIYYVTSVRLPFVLRLFKPPASASGDRYVGRFTYLSGPQRLPLFKPPWGSLVAIDMRTGDHLWRAPVGSGNSHPIVKQLGITERLGWPFRSFVLATKSLLLTVQSGYQTNQRPAASDPGRRIFDLNNLEPMLSAFDKATGALIAEIALPANASGAPITYMAGGKQYVAFPVGGSNIPEELIAVALP